MQVHIEVLDENDNAPEFAKPYEAKVCEDAPQGKVSLVQVGGRGSTCLGQAEGEHLPATISWCFTECNAETEAQRECVMNRLGGRELVERGALQRHSG